LETEALTSRADTATTVANAAIRRGVYWRSREGLLVIPPLIFFLVIYIYPLSRLVTWSLFDPVFTLEHYRKLFSDPTYFTALVNTLDISVWVTVISLLVGYPLAYLMVTESHRVRTLLMTFVLIPFWTSILVRTFAWIVILGRNGIVNQTLKNLGVIDTPIQMIHNMTGVQVGMVHVLLPFMVLPLYGVMSRIDLDLMLAARSLGAPPYKVFLRVFLPLSLPGVTAGCVLVFLLAVGFYITPALLGGPGEITLATLIEMMINDLLNWGFGATLSVVLLLVVGVLFVIFSSLMGLDRLTGTGGGS
jgi:ABC-type spermidine/putrescine transport system permease subunit I